MPVIKAIDTLSCLMDGYQREVTVKQAIEWISLLKETSPRMFYYIGERDQLEVNPEAFECNPCRSRLERLRQ